MDKICQKLSSTFNNSSYPVHDTLNGITLDKYWVILALLSSLSLSESEENGYKTIISANPANFTATVNSTITEMSTF